MKGRLMFVLCLFSIYCTIYSIFLNRSTRNNYQLRSTISSILYDLLSSVTVSQVAITLSSTITVHSAILLISSCYSRRAGLPFVKKEHGKATKKSEKNGENCTAGGQSERNCLTSGKKPQILLISQFSRPQLRNHIQTKLTH